MCGVQTVTALLALSLLDRYGRCAGPISFYSRSVTSGKCSLPPQPSNGFYTVNDFQFSDSDGPYYSEGGYLSYGCYPGYELIGDERVDCNGATWGSPPTCKYNENTAHDVIKGMTARLRQFPWHVGIYFKSVSGKKLPLQVCGGTIISPIHIITAAHCLYKGDTRLNKRWFTVVADKLYREFNHRRDTKAQFRDIQEIHIPQAYQGRAGNFADDIALIVLDHPLSMKHYVRAANIDWSEIGKIIDPGTEGTVAGWGLTGERGLPSSEMQHLTMPVVPKVECKSTAASDFRKYLTFDKFCAGHLTGSSLCRGDNGGGFITRKSEGPKSKYYLKGIVSVAEPKDGAFCDSQKYTGFTSITRQLEWLRPLVLHL